MICRYIWRKKLCGDQLNTINYIVRNTASIFIKCIDVTVTVFVIFGILYLIVSVIKRLLYSKTSKSRRSNLVSLLWEIIIPNTMEISKVEVYLASNIDVFCGEKIKWSMTLSTLANIHKQSLYIIAKEGVIESFDSKKSSKKYLEYIKEINLPSVYVFLNRNTIL